jgi:hypothetical protein
VLAEDAIRAALKDYKTKKEKAPDLKVVEPEPEAPKPVEPRTSTAPGWNNPPVLGGWNQNAMREIDRRWAK